jgi:predicted DNA-binding transcriptional regulator YafY
VFRCDRILGVHREEVKFTPPEGFSLESVLRDGKVLSGAEAPQMRVRYSPRIARWIAEREHVAEEADGSVAMNVPVFDDAWAVRRVLRYGPDAVVESPESVRARLRAELEALIAAGA